MELKQVEAMKELTADGECSKIKVCLLTVTWESTLQVINYFANTVLHFNGLL